ncbi:unnamed protein product, partial [Closterium sp. NIES-54]
SFSASASISPCHSPLLCLPATRSQLHLLSWPCPGSAPALAPRAAATVPGSGGTRRRGLTGVQLLLTLAATKASTLHGCTATSTTSAASTTAAAASTASATASTASTAATDAPTPGTTPTTTSTSSTASSTAPSTTLASLALASAASPTRGRRSADLLSANEVDSSSRGNRGEKGDRGTPLKEGGATVAARSPNS